jgi:hypothetical protein
MFKPPKPIQPVPGQPVPEKAFGKKYREDPAFKQQVDESRMQQRATVTTRQLQDALATSRGVPGSKPKMY